MFVFNGFVYGGEPEQMIKIKSVKVLPDYMMLIVFNNGEERLFDATILSGPVYEPLKNEEIFNGFEIDHGVLTWMDGSIDCAPEYIYANSYEYIRNDTAVKYDQVVF